MVRYNYQNSIPKILQLLIALILTLSCNNPETVKSPASITTSGVPPVPVSLVQQYEKYQNRKSASLLDWLPGGNGILVRRWADETEQLHTVAAPGDSIRQLTFFKESVIFAYVCPDPKRNCVVFTKDSGGDERFQIYQMELGTSSIQQLTHDSAQNGGIVWSNNGKWFAYSSNRRNGKDFDIYRTDIGRPGEDRLLLTQGGAWNAVEWSPDDRKLLVGEYVSRTNSRLFILAVETGKIAPLTDTLSSVSQELGAWGPEGRGIFYTSDEYTDFRCLRYKNISNGAEQLLTGDLKWDVREIVLSPDRRTLVFTTNEDGFSQVYTMDTRTFAYQKITCLPLAIIGSPRFHPDGKKLALHVNAPDHPEDVYVIDINDFSSTRWTESSMGGLDPDRLVRPEVIRYPAFDSVAENPRMLPCFIYKPMDRKTPYPVLITIHGGPESQFWPSFKTEIQFYCNELGVAVAAPNVRGSGGYGKNFLTLDNGYSREDAVRDIGALIDWIGTQPEFDASRIAVKGGSYGGYMALASMVRYSDKLRAGIDSYGIGNFITFLENTSEYRRDLRRVEYGDERDMQMRNYLLSISPLTNVRRIKKPLLIIQGANDARVPLSESQQIADALQKQGTPVWMVVAHDEGHGFRKKSNRDYKEWVTALFLREHLLNGRGY